MCLFSRSAIGNKKLLSRRRRRGKAKEKGKQCPVLPEEEAHQCKGRGEKVERRLEKTAISPG